MQWLPLGEDRTGLATQAKQNPHFLLFSTLGYANERLRERGFQNLVSYR
ncbi:MAG: hypothetical protein V7K85_24970 [Nostoc sp.]